MDNIITVFELISDIITIWVPVLSVLTMGVIIRYIIEKLK